MDSKKDVQHVYLVGAKSLGAYGGYETFVYKLTEYQQNKKNIRYTYNTKNMANEYSKTNSLKWEVQINVTVVLLLIDRRIMPSTCEKAVA